VKRRDSLKIAQPFEDYLKMLGVKWDVEQYKKDLPLLIKEFEVKD
jgi:hypothetical protein